MVRAGEGTARLLLTRPGRTAQLGGQPAESGRETDQLYSRSAARFSIPPPVSSSVRLPYCFISVFLPFLGTGFCLCFALDFWQLLENTLPIQVCMCVCMCVCLYLCVYERVFFCL